jgi:hypothetical protein
MVSRAGGPGPWVSAHGLQNCKMISAIESVTKGSGFMKAKGYAPSNLSRASEIGQQRAASPIRGGGAGSPWWHHGRAWWLAGVGVGVHYGLRFRVVPSSNQSGGRGVLTKRYSGQWRTPEVGERWNGLCPCSR